jgi:hypothetical protein
MPGGSERALGDAVPFKKQMRNAARAQMLAHRQPGVAAANDERV